MGRLSWDAYWIEQAKVVAKRGTCLRRNYGAIIVSSDNRLISQGYTGAPKGTPNCCDIGWCLRKKLKVPSGQRYELCRSVHAEQNAIINSAINGTTIPDGAKMYIYGFSVEDGSSVCGKPCLMCRRVIINAGIKEVIFLSSDGKSLKKQLVVGWVENSKERPEGDLEYGN